jgi:hypothetical protein
MEKDEFAPCGSGRVRQALGLAFPDPAQIGRNSINNLKRFAHPLAVPGFRVVVLKIGT